MQRTTDIANINDINVLHVLNNIFFFLSFFIFKVISTLFQGPYFIEWNFSIRNQMRKITNGSVDFSRITIKTHWCFDSIRSRAMDPLEEAIDVAVSSRKKLREYCSPSVRPRTLRCHLTKRPNPRRPRLSVPTRRSLDHLSSLKFRDCNRTRSTTPYKQTVSSYSFTFEQNIISGDLGDVCFFFFFLE